MRNNLLSRQWICLKPLSDRGWLFFPNTKPCLKPMGHQCPCEQHFSLSTVTWPKTILMPTHNSAYTGLNNTAGARGPYGDADTLSRAKGTSVDGVDNAGVIASGEGKVRLHRWSEYPNNWNPHTDFTQPNLGNPASSDSHIKTSGRDRGRCSSCGGEVPTRSHATIGLSSLHPL